MAAILLSALSGVPGLFASRRSAWGQRLAAVLMGGASIAGLLGAATVLVGGPSADGFFPWPAAGDSIVGVDALGAFFLMPVFLMGGLGSIYGLGYWPCRRHPGNAARLQVFWGLLVAGLALLVASRHAMAFLFGWELMALSAYFLVATEDQRGESRRAGLIYLIATHIGTLALFGFFALWRSITGSWDFRPISAEASSLVALNLLFLLALLGFGLKAGVMPLHFWLPGAHAAAPSHVSAILSGLVLKMGIYGLLRFLSLLPDPPPAWGAIILALGAVSGLAGVAFAIAQHDLKRLLAYHSIENIGIILMGLGLAMLGRSAHRPEWIVLGLGGCLLHVWNHFLFKSLLFFGAGSVVHATRTREIDSLGGLAKSMPWTASLFLVGAVAICGLPPLNGFISELLVYFGLFGTLDIGGPVSAAGGAGAAVLAAPVLATIGALAVACFVKVYGVVFLGAPRSRKSLVEGESPLTMLLPMIVLAALCALIGLAPGLVAPILDGVIATWMPASGSPGNLAPATALPATTMLADGLPATTMLADGLPASTMLADGLPAIGSLVPLGIVGAMTLSIAGLGLVAVIVAVLIGRRRGSSRSPVPTWDCGYAAPTARMEYTASSFAASIVSLYSWLLRPREAKPRIEGPFPDAAGLESHVDDIVLDRILIPATRRAERGFGWFRRFQQGLAQNYVLYILIAVILLLGTLVPFRDIIMRLFAR
jgi:hydrogenase-4 component B